jgi:hypothetical protein
MFVCLNQVYLSALEFVPQMANLFISNLWDLSESSFDSLSNQSLYLLKGKSQDKIYPAAHAGSHLVPVYFVLYFIERMNASISIFKIKYLFILMNIEIIRLIDISRKLKI